MKETAILGLDGAFKYEHIRNGEVIESWTQPNIVVDEGLIYVLNTAVGNVSQISNWYIGLYKNNYTPLAGDVMSDLPGAAKADEAVAEYAEGTRGAFVPTATNAKVIINTPLAFTFNQNVDIYGGLMASESGKGSTSGILLAASKFSAVRQMLSGDVLNVTYELTIADV